MHLLFAGGLGTFLVSVPPMPRSWRVEPMAPQLGANLPSSVKADYETMNALRTFDIQASAIAIAIVIVCGILLGI
ncbi:MAG: hypothetical protein P8I61_03290 [Opitutae bacterium]|nr:hypothetical protein [Opitutae bacterium]